MSELSRLQRLAQPNIKLPSPFPITPGKVKAKRKGARLARIWLYPKGSLSDPKQGYSIRETGRKKYPWRSEVWHGRRLFRTDDFPSREQAEAYCRERKKSFYGGK